ncbi:MAG: histidine phosphatase family protein [Gammaproteobacteria bacterium]|nr:histidine phosphatase family protein [Gammaproteobacteria bacterium]
MQRTLLLLRHAKSDWSSSATDDFSRPLSRRGKHDSPRMGQWLQSHGLLPDYVVSSPAKRAHQTIKRVARELGIDSADIHWDERLYLASLSDLLAVIADCPLSTRSILLVGHNPGLESLLRHLAAASVSEPADGKLMPTAALAVLETRADWQHLQRGSAQLRELVRPRHLSL